MAPGMCSMIKVRISTFEVSRLYKVLFTQRNEIMAISWLVWLSWLPKWKCRLTVWQNHWWRALKRYWGCLIIIIMVAVINSINVIFTMVKIMIMMIITRWQKHLLSSAKASGCCQAWIGGSPAGEWWSWWSWQSWWWWWLKMNTTSPPILDHSSQPPVPHPPPLMEILQDCLSASDTKVTFRVSPYKFCSRQGSLSMEESDQPNIRRLSLATAWKPALKTLILDSSLVNAWKHGGLLLLEPPCARLKPKDVSCCSLNTSFLDLSFTTAWKLCSCLLVYEN